MKTVFPRSLIRDFAVQVDKKKTTLDPRWPSKAYQTMGASRLIRVVRCTSEDIFAHVAAQILTPGFTNITKTRLFKYIENFTTKNGKFSDKKI